MASLTKKYKVGNYDFITDQSNPYFITGAQSRQPSSKANDKITNKATQLDDNRISASRNTASKAKSEMNYSKSGNSAYSASIKQRIQKVCTTNSTLDLRKQNALLNRQIQRLQKQILKRDQQILQMRTKVMPSKQVKTQLFQLYRALNYFEGKTKQMESQIYKFRQMILKSSDQGITADNLNVLFEELRRDNQELSAQIEQTEYIRASIEDRYNRLKTKYFETQRQLSQYKRRQISPLHQYYLKNGSSGLSNNKFNRMMNELVGKNAPTSMEIKQREIINRQLSMKLQQAEKQISLIHQQMEKISQQLDKIKMENQMLKNDLDDKDRHITELFKDYMGAKKSLKKIESERNIGIPSSVQNWTPSFKNSSQKGSMSNI